MIEKLYTIVQSVHIDETGDSYYRMRWPGRTLAEQAPEWRVINVSAEAQERLKWGLAADLLIVFQSHDVDLLRVLKMRREAGKRTLVEYNDNFYDPPPESPVAEVWRSPLTWQSYERFMLESDGVIVTGPGLNEALSAKVPQADFHILENHLPDKPPDFDSVWSDPNGRVNIGWAGSVGHMGDLLALVPLFQDLLQYPQVHFCFMGNESIPSLINLPSDRFSFRNWGAMADYYDFLKELHIGLAPLRDTAYNRCRSDVKALELSSRAVLPLLTRALPYENFLSETGLESFRSFEELKGLITSRLDDPEKLKEDVRRSYEYVCSKRTAINRTERLELYKSFLPAVPENFSWPCSSGYHELGGTSQSEPSVNPTLNQIKQLASNKQWKQAEELAQKTLDENQYHDLMAINHLRIVARIDPGRARETAELYQQRFPRDLRFLIIRLGLERDSDLLPELWRELLDLLAGLPSYSRTVFEQAVVARFAEQAVLLLQAESREEFSARLQAIYPDNAQLLMAFARVYEEQGLYEESSHYFNRLLELHRSVLKNHKFLSSVQEKYLESFRDLLQNRVKGSF